MDVFIPNHVYWHCLSYCCPTISSYFRFDYCCCCCFDLVLVEQKIFPLRLSLPCHAFLFRQSQEEGGTGTAANRSRQSLLQTHTHSLCSPHTPSFAHSLSLSLSFDQSTSFSCTFFLQFLQFFSWTPHTTKQNKKNRKQKAAAAATTSAFI